jgi:hypothetical protein
MASRLGPEPKPPAAPCVTAKSRSSLGMDEAEPPAGVTVGRLKIEFRPSELPRPLCAAERAAARVSTDTARTKLWARTMGYQAEI